jgi:hypothetical protein
VRALVLCLVLAGAASAQPALVTEASVDREAYGYGEPVTLRYTLRNEGTEPAVLWEYCDSHTFTLDSFTSPGADVACVTMAERREIAPGGSATWVWIVDPKELGVPDGDGLQTITGRTDVRCGPDEATTTQCQLEASATFTAPRYVGGALAVEYPLANADTVAALERAYRATVADSSARNDEVHERWLIEGTSVSDAVAALNENGVVSGAKDVRTALPVRVTSGQPGPAPAALTPPAPNPTVATATFTVRLAGPEAVTIDLVDALGRRVAVLHDGPLAGGVDHPFRVSVGSLPAGVYTVRVLGRTVRQSHRVTVAR